MQLIFAWLVTGCLAIGISSTQANAALIIDVGTHDLLPNTANQAVQVFVHGGDAVQGVDFNAQVADGGTEAGGSIAGPSISIADILTGTIFASNNMGVDDPGSFPQLAIRTTTAANGSVSAEGLLATLEIDTTNFTFGTWALNLGETLNGPTDFAGISAAITDGLIRIVPEPGATVLLSLCGALGLRRQQMCR